MKAELRRAAVMTWAALSIATTLALVLPAILPQSVVAGVVPACESQLRDGTPCAFCGMTRAFYCISEGAFAQAATANALSLPLYIGFLINAAAGTGLAVRRWRSRQCNS